MDSGFYQLKQDDGMKFQKGNILFWVLLGIVLFGGLSMVVKRAGESTDMMTADAEKMSIAAAEIIDYAEAVKTAALRMMASGRCTETQISFENDVYLNFDGTVAQPLGSHSTTTDRCKIFNESGGKLEPLIPATMAYQTVTAADQTPETVLQMKAGHPVLAKLQIINVGRNGDIPELVLKIMYLPDELCRAINRIQKVPGSSNDYLPINNDWGARKFAGDYSVPFATAGMIGNVDATLMGQTSFCARYSATSSGKRDAAFFHVIYAR